jgi:DNA-binding CsgD family transcriptional regulator
MGPRLTAQEREILFWVRQGKSNAQIALILEVKLSTVKKHLQNASSTAVIASKVVITNSWVISLRPEWM